MDFASFLGCVKETTEDETASAELRVQSSDLRQLESVRILCIYSLYFLSFLYKFLGLICVFVCVCVLFYVE